jgi:type VI secretion system secreted protein VgrG
MEIATPLGHDVLLFHHMHAREELSRLSEFHIDLLSEKPDIDLDQILGKMVTVKLELVDRAGYRFYNGYVTRFSQGGMYGRYHLYHAIVRPWLWFLTRTADCKIFQDMPVPDIIKAVFGDHGTADFAFELTGSYRPWVYCVQYRETDFNFVSRLMEEEGIYYYFRHTDGHDTLVLTDSVGKHAPAATCAKLPFIPPGRLVRPELEHVSAWDFSREIQPGVYVHDDYDFKKPPLDLKTQKVLARGYTPSDYEMFDYPGHYELKPDGDQYALMRIEELGARYEAARGVTNARNLSTGHLLTLEGCPRDDQNCEHLVLSSVHDLEFSAYEGLPQQGPAEYRCSFEAMSTKEQFRPQRSTPKPFVQGPQTAEVVGPGGDEIYVDQYGRVKVQFHWDRYHTKNEESSCWIRVSSPWAGKVWGAIALPRIGQEVIVDFLEGDPDQPIITGRVYNAIQMPPYDLPANKTQSGVKSRSTLYGGADNFNEIRFEDKKGVEQLFIHAERNQDIEVEKDETHWVGRDRKKTIDHDETSHIQHDRTETVDNNETITIGMNRTERVGVNESITVGGNRTITVSQNETATVALQRTHTVGVNETITVGAAQQITVGGFQALTVGALQAISVGANQTTNVGNNLSTSVASNESRKVGGGRTTDIGKSDGTKVAQNWVVDAGDSVTIKTGDASITMKKDGTISIRGKDISIQGSGKIQVKASGQMVLKGSKIGAN